MLPKETLTNEINVRETFEQGSGRRAFLVIITLIFVGSLSLRLIKRHSGEYLFAASISILWQGQNIDT